METRYGEHTESGMPVTTEFSGDEKGYFDWIGANRLGFVLNLRRVPDVSYAVLHRAKCGTISSEKVKWGAYTERDYVKVCSNAESSLRDHLGRVTGKEYADFSKRCGMCRP